MTVLPDRFLPDLCELLAIPSVSTWPDHRPQIRQAAGWLARRLEAAGLAARLLEGPPGAAPCVYAETAQSPDRPTILLYGHYDVQPAEAADGWTSSPFAPTLRDGRIYARGATDQKMNLLLPIFCLEAIGLANLAFNIKLLYEGEEELLSPNLRPMLERHKDLLACDMVFSTDGWQHSPAQGDLRLGLRGFAGVEVTLRGSSKDLHSGTYGGAVPNPALALARLLASLHHADGRIAIPGFFDGIAPLSAAEEAAVATQTFDRAQWLGRAGLGRPPTLAGLIPPDRIGLEPTLEINAFEAGHYAAGFRTIVPAKAQARISARLVAGQEPRRIAELLRGFLSERVPDDFTATIDILPGSSRPYRIPPDHPGQRLAFRILEEIDGTAPRYSFSGGSIPIPGEIDDILGVKTIIFGFGLPDQNMHGIDEHCRLTDIERGLAAWRMLLEQPGLPAVMKTTG